MSASQDSTSLPALSGEPTPKRIILPMQARSPESKLGTEGKIVGNDSGGPKRSRQRSKKGQRFNLKSLLHGAADETQDEQKDDQDDEIEQGVADLGIRGSEEKNQVASNTSDGEASVEIAAATTEYAYDHDDAANYSQEYHADADFDSGTYEDDDNESAYDEHDISEKPINLPTKGRLSKKGKGDRWEQPVDREDLIGAVDGPLAPRSQAIKKKSKKVKEKEKKERDERNKAEEERQEANLRAGRGRIVGPMWGNINTRFGYGGGGMDR